MRMHALAFPVVVLLLLPAVPAAQVSMTTVQGTSVAEGRALAWTELEALHGALADRAASYPDLAQARADVAKVLDENGSFRALSARESRTLIAAHNRIVDVLGVGVDHHLRCEKLTAVASKVRQTICFLGD